MRARRFRPAPEPKEDFALKRLDSIRNARAEQNTLDVRFVAEVSSNHQTDLDRALRFVDRAAEIGCDGVKFQLFRIDQLFAPEVLEKSREHRDRRRWELPERFLAPIAERCRAHRIAFGCTPFYLEAVDALASFVDFLKIASYELLWDDLLRATARTGLPIVLSTGMATLEEVGHATRVLVESGARDLTLLHCVSGYPAPPAQANLGAIDVLAAFAERFPQASIRAGWSDHTVSPGVIHRAVHAHPTRMIEFHLDLEGEGDEYEAGHCWLPEAMAETIRSVRTGFEAEGDGAKAPAEAEASEREWRADPSDGLRPLRHLRTQWAPLV